LQFPVVFHIGDLGITAHAVLETLAYFIAFRYMLYLRRKSGDNFSTNTRIWILLGAILGSLIGSHLLGSLERPQELRSTGNIFRYIAYNKTVLGGFLGGLFGVELVKKIIGETRASGDLYVYPLLLGTIIGRLGCFSMGVHEETYGTTTSLPWGINLGDGLSRHPVALYEIGFLIVLWIILKQLSRRTELAPGALFKLFMIAYLLYRFLQEFIKPHYNLSIGLSSIQVASLLGLLYYYRFLIHPKKLKPAAYA
jgi:phosphatidylglycerol---prolipoprotein diacylglyceryl transferase